MCECETGLKKTSVQERLRTPTDAYLAAVEQPIFLSIVILFPGTSFIKSISTNCRIDRNFSHTRSPFNPSRENYRDGYVNGMGIYSFGLFKMIERLLRPRQQEIFVQV